MINYVYVRLEEPFRTRAVAYRDELRAAAETWRAFGERCGGTPGAGWNGFYFGDDPPPNGWRTPRRDGWSIPKKGTDDWVEYRKLPQPPDTRKVFTAPNGESAVLETCHYETEGGGRGFRMIASGLWNPVIGWLGDTFYAIIPDPRKLVASDPDLKYDDLTLGWTVPEGLVEMTDAEYELALAEYRVKLERSKR